MSVDTTAAPDHFVYPHRPAHAAPVTWDFDDDDDDVTDLEAAPTSEDTGDSIRVDFGDEDLVDLTEHDAIVVTWTTSSDVAVDDEPGVAAPAGTATSPDDATSQGAETISLATAGRWIGARTWLRRHATWQIAAPCLAGAITGTAALLFTQGALARLGQVVATAALVTIGLAWAQAVQDQRRRQQDLRFRLASGNLERADLSGTVLDGFMLWGQNLRGARMASCSADHVLLSGADLREASMPGISLRAASLCGADLTGATAFRADLSAADLTDAIAIGTGFEQAVLRGARLEGADLSGADLSGADLRGATHDDATVWADVIVSEDTRLPDDVDLAAHHTTTAS